MVLRIRRLKRDTLIQYQVLSGRQVVGKFKLEEDAKAFLKLLEG